jgi:hypothetical protein
MPYGTKTVMCKPMLRWTKASVPYPGYLDAVSSLSPTLTGDSYTRSGTDRNTTIRKKRQRATTYTYKLVWKEIPRWTKVKVVDPRSGKWHYVKKKILTNRLVRVRLPRQKPKWKNDLLVNDLTYQSSKIVAVQAAEITIKAIGTNYYPNYPTWLITGDTWHLGNSFPSGFGLGLPSRYSPDSYGSGYLSTDFLPQINALQAKALGAVFAKAKDQNVNLGNFLAEIHKTKGSFVEIVKRLAKVILSVKKGNIAKAWRTLVPSGTDTKAISNDFLLWTYGIAPLLSDIDGMTKQLADGFKDGEDIVVKSVQSTIISSSENASSTSSILYRREQLDIKTTVTVRTVLKFKLSNPALQNLSQLGLTNPATVAWEITPWSFVIDWIIPIGNWLDTLDTWAMLVPVSYHETTVVKQEIVCSAVHNGTVGAGASLVRTTGGFTYWKKENVYLSRKTKALPTPPFPRVKNPFSVGHIMNALALLRQLRP